MGLPDIFDFERLTIEDANDAQEKIEAMFNPSTFSLNFANRVADPPTTQAGGTPVEQIPHVSSQANKLRIKLIFDGTGVTQFGLLTGFGFAADDVPTKIEKFLNLCFYVDDATHEPPMLKIKWGKAIKEFNAKLTSLSINYTMFDMDGTPLRAELDCEFIGRLVGIEGGAGLITLNSPDLTHLRVVKAGDTLTQLAKEVYGSASYYLKLAAANGLDNFRDLQPGQEIVFPPIK